MGTDTDKGHLCYRAGNNHLAHNRGNGHLIYRDLDLKGTATITIEWFNSDRDLDILGFWEDDSGRRCGWSQGYSGPYNTGVYQSEWSGDNTSEAGSEWIKIKMVPWTHGGSRRYFVYFNFYGEGSSCNVYVEQGGKTLSKGQSCSSRKGQKAETSDPCCIVTFNKDGSLKELR